MKRQYRRENRRSSFEGSPTNRVVSPDVLCSYCPKVAVAFTINDPDHLACLDHTTMLPNVPLLMSIAITPTRIR